MPYDDLTDRTCDLVSLADVKRWVTIKTLRDQNVAEHSFAVAVIVMELWQRLKLREMDIPTALETITWALFHDGPEVLTGDIDGKFKRDFPVVKKAIAEAEADAFPWYRDTIDGISVLAVALVKLADKMESIAFIRQWGLGARADDVRRELEAILFTELVPRAAEVMGKDEDKVEDAVRYILHHSLSEENSVQLRRFRTMVDTDE
jgi:5'-deoxynucleotidase